MPHALAALTLSILASLASPAPAVERHAQQAPPAKTDCSAPEHRQFDFWLGSWDVTNQGKPAGTNRIESAMGGCALLEHWRSASGSDGMSVNFYDRATKTWSQAWIDQGGNALHLKGGLKNGRMILQSDPQATAAGGMAVQRITWSKEADRSVRQLWESSSDNGKTWTVAFDGRYVAKP